MKMRVSLVAVALVLGKMTFAQSVDDGKRFLYYQRYQSAKDAFQKALTAKPNDGEITYLLGQAELGLKDSTGARDLYQKAVQANGNDPWLLVGIGQTELMFNNVADAKNRFETAISLTKAKDPAILNAVARANIDATMGDANYAIEKLNQALEKEKKHPQALTYVNLGDAYSKLIDGGNAITNYTNALTADPKYAAAYYGQGLIYETQKNPAQYVPDFEAAAVVDPNYAPAFYRLYSHFYTRDVDSSKVYLQKYTAVTDPGPRLDLANADVLYAGQHYQEAIDKSKALLGKVPDDAKPHLHRLMAYVYYEMKDYANAKTSIDLFLANPLDVYQTPPPTIAPKNYVKAGEIYYHAGASTDSVFSFLEKAIALDTVPTNKKAYMQEAANLSDSLKDPIQKAYWVGQIYQSNPNATNLDLYNWGTTLFNAAEAVRARDSAKTGASNPLYTRADSVFGVYSVKYPEQVYGYYWRARANAQLDTNFAKGLANPYYEKMVQVADSSKDSASYVPNVEAAYGYFINYYLKKKDYKNIYDYCVKYLTLDPNNDQIKHLRDVLEKYINKANASGGAAKTGK
jgi:tetratricopeptide (TPR) repeat protein